MSRMTKFLKQKCLVQPYELSEEGKPSLNRFGEILYLEPVVCKCRKEKVVQDVVTTNGAVLKSSFRFFLDESFEICIDYLIDGKAVLMLTEYINEVGDLEGYEVYT